MSALDPDLLATLTPEEREAFNDDDDAAAAAAAAASPDDDKDDKDDDDNDVDQADAAPVEGKGASDADDAGDKADAADAQPAAAATPAAATRYEAALPSDFDAQVKALSDKEAELKRAFRSGEMEFDEFESQRDELLREREAMTIARAKAEISQEMAAQSAQQQWQNTIARFMDVTAREAGLDYRQDSGKAADLDQFVRFLGQQDANADKPMDWFLQEAHKRVMALHGMTAPASAAARGGDPVAEATARRRPAPEATPRTLAQVPGAGGPGDIGSEFGDVLSLDGMEYEAAIARMTPAQRERFARV